MKSEEKKLTLAQPAAYRIWVQGCLDNSWTEWSDAMAISVDSSENSGPTTHITVTVDQAALQGLLRRLYTVGLPLISVECLDFTKNMEDE